MSGLIRTSQTLGFNLDSRLNVSGGVRAVGQAPIWEAKSAPISIPFRVRKLIVRASVCYFQGLAPYVQPDSILQIWSDIGGPLAPIIHIEHDQEMLNGVYYQYNVESLQDIRGSYTFQLRDLSGNIPLVDADPNVAPQLSASINILIDFSA